MFILSGMVVTSMYHVHFVWYGNNSNVFVSAFNVSSNNLSNFCFQSESMKQAEVAAYFRRFEDAEKCYLDMDRR